MPNPDRINAAFPPHHPNKYFGIRLISLFPHLQRANGKATLAMVLIFTQIQKSNWRELSPWQDADNFEFSTGVI